MPLLIAILVSVAAFVWWSWGRHKAAGEVASRMDRLTRRKPCRWQAAGGDGARSLKEYRCSVCKGVGYSATGRPPTECKRHLKPGL